MTLGSTVWDIGANVGIYTRKFAETVGASGKVVAFEPSPTTFLTLQKNTSDLSNVTLVNIALADFIGASEFHSAGENDPTAGMSQQRTDAKSLSVEVTKADQFLEIRPELYPHAMKIDVEGFEIDVLRGMKAILGSPDLKAIFIEVHFTMLSRRGKGNAPSEIRDLLIESGFAVNWADASHIYALRKIES